MPELSDIGCYKFYIFENDVNENRKHVHIIKGKNLNPKAKIWLEKNGKKCIEFAYDNLSKRARKNIVRAINDNWKSLTERIDKVFNGQKVHKSHFKYKQMCAYKDITAKIKKVKVDDRLSVSLEDGREISVPVNMVPSLEKLSKEDRRKFSVFFGHIITFEVPNVDISIKDLVNLNLQGSYLENIEVEEHRKKNGLEPKGYI